MVELAFRAYVDGYNIVAVAFPSSGGGAVLRQEIPLDSIGLACTGSPPAQFDMPFETFSVASRQALVRGGLELVVEYETQRVTLTPYSHTGSPIHDRTVTYTFDGLALDDARESAIQQSKSKAKFRITADSLPVSDETWP